MLLEALTGLNPAARPTVEGMGWWEYDLYVGVIGLGLLLGLGLAVMTILGALGFAAFAPGVLGPR